MNKKEAETRKTLEKLPYKVVDEFKNEHGEKWLIYYIKSSDGRFFATGDEVNWELGWEINNETKSLINKVNLSRQEFQRMRRIFVNEVAR